MEVIQALFLLLRNNYSGKEMYKKTNAVKNNSCHSRSLWKVQRCVTKMSQRNQEGLSSGNEVWAEPWKKARWTRTWVHLRHIHVPLLSNLRLLDVDSTTHLLTIEDHEETSAQPPFQTTGQHSPECPASSRDRTVGSHNIGNLATSEMRPVTPCSQGSHSPSLSLDALCFLSWLSPHWNLPPRFVQNTLCKSILAHSSSPSLNISCFSWP